MSMWVQKDFTPVIADYLVSYVEEESKTPWLALHPRANGEQRKKAAQGELKKGCEITTSNICR